MAPLRILMADDSLDNRLIVQILLPAAEYRVDTVTDGQAAVDQCFRAEYDAILMDIEMPVLDGCEATRRIREREVQESRRRVPIIALTAYGEESDVRRILGSGCDAHVVKPLTREKLCEAIRLHTGH